MGRAVKGARSRFGSLLVAGLVAGAISALGAGIRIAGPAEAAETPAPLLDSPAANLILSRMALDLSWHGVADATQYHVQVTPINNDGPGINVIRGSETNLAVPLTHPVFGPYILLPDMTYHWRVRASTKATSASEDDASWSGWSEERPFRTPRPPDSGTRVIEPLEGAQISPGPVRFRWGHSDPAVFYWEVQVSKEPSFDTNPSTGPSFVWWNLIHGGVSSPRNSWVSPELPANAYYWRVRPRVQGDGRPGVWSATTRFTVSGSPSTPTPTPGLPIPAPSATPGPGVTDALVTFESNRGGDFEVYSQRLDGSPALNLTNHKAHDRVPRWSPDGSKLAFVSDRDGGYRLYVMNADGGEVKGGEPVEHFAWSPDSTKLAVADPAVGVRIHTDTLSLYKTLAEAEAYIGFAGLGWSPDSQRLAVSARSGSNRDHRIYVYSWRSGVTSTEITGNTGDNREPRYQVGFLRITFLSNRGRSYDIWDATEAGSGRVNLTQSEAVESQISWSPRGGKLLYVRTSETGTDVWSMNADGSNPLNLTNTAGDDTDPVWSPDGTRVLFTSRRDGNSEVYVMNADGSDQTNLSQDPAIDRNPSWAPK